MKASNIKILSCEWKRQDGSYGGMGALPRDAERSISVNIGVVAIAVTQPPCPLRVPARVICSAMMTIFGWVSPDYVGWPTLALRSATVLWRRPRKRGRCFAERPESRSRLVAASIVIIRGIDTGIKPPFFILRGNNQERFL